MVGRGDAGRGEWRARCRCRMGRSPAALVARLAPMFFDATFDPMVTSKTPGAGRDILQSSANNLYDGVAMADLDGFTERHPLNSRLVKRDGQLVEEVYRVGGLYHDQIVRIVWTPAGRGGGGAAGAAARRSTRWSASTRRATTAIARRSTSPGCRTTIRRWTR